MSMYDFFVSAIGEVDDPILWVVCAFTVFYCVIDFVHTFYSAVFSWFKK